MKNNNTFSCVIIGEGTLPLRCAELLLASGHEICSIVSPDPEIKRWTRENEISHLEPGANLSEHLSKRPFDYLFSIVNEHILREDVLLLPRKLAINYHDALLPSYAGKHATSWALMNGETSHGVSWHLITDVVDAGDILKQRRIEINHEDTALTLNTKCYEAAINAFTELIEELSTASTAASKQNLDERTYFPRYKRPVNGCVISWDNCAADISAFVRALDFGPHPNPLGSPKLSVGNDFVVIPELEILKSESPTAPGTINGIGVDSLRVSARDREVVLRKVLTLGGRSVSIPDLVARFNLQEGYQFKDLPAETAQRLEADYATNCKHEAFWVNKLAALEPAAPPYSISTTKANPPRYGSLRMHIPAEVLSFLERQPELSADDVVLAAYGALLARLGGVDSFDVGYKDADLRNEMAGLENFFAAQLPLRINVDGLKSFKELLKAVKGQVEAVKKHRTYAQDLVMRYPELRSAGDAENNFALPVTVEKVKRLDDRETVGEGEITLVISESESECRWIYDQERVDEESIRNLVRHFTTLLKGIAANPECQVAYLPLLTKQERHQLLVEWNDNRTGYPKDQCIHQLFEAQVSRTPDAVALISGERRLTYRELNQRANQLANYLRTLGVGPELLVGICVERSVEMFIGLLGILKAGGAYVPLDPAYPKERLTLMLEDSQASVVLTQQKFAADLAEDVAQVICLDKDRKRIAQEGDENPVSLTTGNNLAYVIYTSGSTGKPKGVAIEHRNTVSFLYWATSVFTPKHLMGVLASTSVCFDLSVYEIFAPLSCGGKVILVENVLHLPTLPAAGEVTLINTVPSAITELLRIKGVPPSVLTVNLAGEPLKTDLVRQIYELGTVKEVFDLYGPTEDTTYSTFTLRDMGRATIGRPISNTQAYILDRYLQPVPAGIPGELYLGGDGLARGYLNRRELTDERFIGNPFSEEATARLYKTGDLTRFLPTGEIEYLGRIDNQVKIRGFRIELGEIEVALCGHPSVSESVVIAREDQPGDKRLAAYVVPNGQPLQINELRSYLKQTLPDHMVPSAFVVLDELPLTANGKVNRKALPAPVSNLSESDRVFVPARDKSESQLVEMWEKILGVQPIGVTDNFFDLGGHSLQAVRMFAEVEKTFGKSIPLATLFVAGTVERIAAILRQEGWSEPESSVVPIQPSGTKPPFFCIHAKGGNVLFYRDLARYLGPDQPFYGIQARRLGGRQVGHATIEEMAAFYIEEMKAVQHEGPYFLGGSSFGGLGAFEMAQQLHAQGDKVALLALLDTTGPGYPKLLPTTTVLRSRIYRLVRRLQHHRESLRILNSQQRMEFVLKRVKKVRWGLHRKFNNAYKKAGRKLYALREQPMPENFFQIEDKLWLAGQNYVPKVYPGKAILFRASNQPLGIYPDPTLGWKGLAAGGLEIHEVPGHHGNIVAEPYVRTLAPQLSRCIEQAQSEVQAMDEALQEKILQSEASAPELAYAAG